MAAQGTFIYICKYTKGPLKDPQVSYLSMAAQGTLPTYPTVPLSTRRSATAQVALPYSRLLSIVYSYLLKDLRFHPIEWKILKRKLKNFNREIEERSYYSSSSNPSFKNSCLPPENIHVVKKKKTYKYVCNFQYIMSQVKKFVYSISFRYNTKIVDDDNGIMLQNVCFNATCKLQHINYKQTYNKRLCRLVLIAKGLKCNL